MIVDGVLTLWGLLEDFSKEVTFKMGLGRRRRGGIGW